MHYTTMLIIQMITPKLSMIVADVFVILFGSLTTGKNMYEYNKLVKLDTILPSAESKLILKSLNMEHFILSFISDLRIYSMDAMESTVLPLGGLFTIHTTKLYGSGTSKERVSM